METVRNISLFICTSISYGIMPALSDCLSRLTGESLFSSIITTSSPTDATGRCVISIVVRFMETRPIIGQR